MTVQNKLSDSELKVMRLLDKGLSNKAIALKLGVSNNTVKFHLKNIYKKLNVHNRLEAIRKSPFHI